MIEERSGRPIIEGVQIIGMGWRKGRHHEKHEVVKKTKQIERPILKLKI